LPVEPRGAELGGNLGRVSEDVLAPEKHKHVLPGLRAASESAAIYHVSYVRLIDVFITQL